MFSGISKGFGVMVCAHTIFILPYIIVTLKSRFADYDVSIEASRSSHSPSAWDSISMI